MNQHDHDHMPDQQPKGAEERPNKDVTVGDHASTHDQEAQPSVSDDVRHADGSQSGQRNDQSRQAGMGHGGMGHMGMSATLPLAYRPTRAQIAAVSFLSVLALTAAVIFSASYANLRLSARDVGGAIMPPGMIMTYDTPGQSMRDMAAVDPRTVSYTAPADARGDQPLEPRMENGVKVFDLDISVIKWNILPYEQVIAYAFNHQVPGPRIRVTEGDRVRINVTNHLPEPTTVHWHGLIVPNAMDGPADITQKPIAPGQTYTYEFTTQQAGTYFYHTHKEPDRQQALGLYGALIIDPKDPSSIPAHDLEYTIELQEWLEREGYTYPAMLMEGALPNFFTINGKAYPATDEIQMKVGQKLLLRFIGSNNNFVHPMHVHGGPFTIVATDGSAVPEAARITKDTVNVGPGERYDVIWMAREPGKWLIHCHIPHHTTNDNVEEQGAGGLTMIINVTP
jgi:manganese oxidase